MKRPTWLNMRWMRVIPVPSAMPGLLPMTMEVTYDRYGNNTGRMEYDADGNVAYSMTTEYEYNENGEVESDVHCDFEGNVLE